MRCYGAKSCIGPAEISPNVFSEKTGAGIIGLTRAQDVHLEKKILGQGGD